MRLTALIFLSAIAAFAVTNPYYNEAKRGWFFYERNDTNETNKTKIVKKRNFKELMKLPDEEFVENLPLDNLDSLSASQFSEAMERMKSIAVMKPSKKNVMALKRMQKFMIDQSEKFAKVWYVATLENPDLEYPNIKTTPFSRTPKYYANLKKEKEFFEKHKDDLGFVVFIDSQDKMQTTRQKWVYEDLKKKYPFLTIKFIDVRERPDLARKFKVKELPDNFFVYKNPRGEAIWERVHSGLVSYERLVKDTMFLFENAILEKDKR